MNKHYLSLLMDVYPTWVINKATRSLGKNATYDQVKAACDKIYNENGRKGKTFMEEFREGSK